MRAKLLIFVRRLRSSNNLTANSSQLTSRLNRMRLTLEVADPVRKFWPQHLPVFTRISASDWSEGGWDIQQSIELSKKLKSIGIDLMDVSSGGLVPYAKIPDGPGYQVPFAAAIKKEVDMPT